MDLANIAITTFFALLELLSGRPAPTTDATVQPPAAPVALVDCPTIDLMTRELLARCEFHLEPEPPLEE